MPSEAQEMAVASAAAPPKSEVMLLPGHVFFVRRIGLPAGMRMEELDSFVEVSLEQMAPFPLNQLFHGYFLPEGGDSLLLYAAYRKKLVSFQGEAWEEARLVAPVFLALLGWPHEGPAAAVLRGDGELTVVRWKDSSPVPAQVISRPIVPGETDIESLRTRLLEKIGASGLPVADWDEPKTAHLSKKGLRFPGETGRAGPGASEIQVPNPWALDVRDKDFLFLRKKTERQNLWVWNLLMVFLFALISLGVLEMGLAWGRRGLDTRQERVEALVDRVKRIEHELELAVRLEELSGTRLLPFEMLSQVNQIRPRSIHFTRAVATGGNILELDAQTRNPQDAERFEAALRGATWLEEVNPDPITPRTVDGRTTFNVQLHFRDGVLVAQPLRQPRLPEPALPSEATGPDAVPEGLDEGVGGGDQP